MEENQILREQIFEVVNTQLDNNDPPETRITYTRLIGMGYDEHDVKKMIGQCVSIEIFEVLKNQKPFDRIRYVKNLNLLPKLP